MTDPLPTAILTEVLALGHALVAVQRAQADGTLRALEDATLAVVRTAAARCLQAVVTGSQSSLLPRARSLRWPCPACGGQARAQSWRPRTVRTTCGPVTYERPWCVCPACHHNWGPTDQTLGIAAGARLSPALTEWVVTPGARLSFREAAENLALLTGLAVSPETTRQLTEAAGAALAAADAAAIAQVEQTQAAAEPVEVPAGALVVETDGVMLRYRGPDRTTAWHEVKLGAVFGYQDGTLLAPSYVAAREPAEAFGPRLLAEAARRGALDILDWVGSPLRRQIARLRTVAVLADGAKWIWGLAAEHFDRRVEILDYYHAAQHLWALAQAVFGEGSDAAAAWVSAQQQQLLTAGSAPLLAALKHLRATTAAAQEVVRVEKGYFRRNADRLAYPHYRAAGLPIGSGAIEASARHLIQLRLKRPGASWSLDGAAGVIHVRCRLLSHRPLLAC